MRSTLASKRVGLLAMTMMAAAALAGCMGAPASSSIYVKDALTDDVSEVYVTFTKAQAKPLDAPWVTVYEGKQTIELLSLSSAEAKERLAAFDLAPGEYEGLRIAVSEVEVTYPDGSQQLLNVFGNIVGVSENFTVGPDGIDILVDFDLEKGVDLAAGTYTPIVKDVQTSADDADDDGISDFDDVDDDDDGLRDDEDDDADGDGEDDEPRQHHGASVEELCLSERDEEFREAQEELDEELREAEEELDEELADANSSEEREDAWQDYNETVAKAQAEYDEEVSEETAEYSECLQEDHSGPGHGDRAGDDSGHDHDEDDHDEARDEDHDEDDHDDRNETDDHDDRNETEEDRSGSGSDDSDSSGSGSGGSGSGSDDEPDEPDSSGSSDSSSSGSDDEPDEPDSSGSSDSSSSGSDDDPDEPDA